MLVNKLLKNREGARVLRGTRARARARKCQSLACVTGNMFTARIGDSGSFFHLNRSRLTITPLMQGKMKPVARLLTHGTGVSLEGPHINHIPR